MSNLARKMRQLAFGLAMFMTMSSVWGAQPPAAVASPEEPVAQSDLTNAQAGSYKLDPKHVAVIARVLHRTFSYSVFRFGEVEGTLEWDPAAISTSRLTTAVQTGSIETNVKGFAEDLVKTLRSAKFPQATFISTSLHRSDPTHARVDGQFTLMGKTEPATFEVSLVGAGPGFTPGGIVGHVIGIHAETSINPHRFGLPDMFGDAIQIVVDTEFDKVP